MKKTYNNTSVIWVDINKCFPHPENPHSVLDSEVIKIQATLKADGLQNPIEVVADGNGDYRIVAGHTRHGACCREGWQEIPVLVLNLESPEAELQHMLLSNFYHNKAALEFAIEMSYWKRIWAKQQGARTDLSNENGSESKSTRAKLADLYDVSEATVGKYEHILNNGRQYFSLVDQGKISLEGAYQLVKFIDDTNLSPNDETELMTRVIDQTDKNFFELIEKGELDLPTAFAKCVRLLGKKMKPQARRESKESGGPPINPSEVDQKEPFFCNHEDCPCFGKKVAGK